MVGGFDGANQLKSVERFNPRTGRWKKVGCLVIFRREEIISTLQVRDMGSPRSGVAAAAFNGSLFVVGGWDGNKRLRTGEVITDQHRLGEDHQHCVVGVQPSYQSLEEPAQDEHSQVSVSSTAVQCTGEGFQLSASGPTSLWWCWRGC